MNMNMKTKKKTQQREERREAKKLDKTDASALFL